MEKAKTFINEMNQDPDLWSVKATRGARLLTHLVKLDQEERVSVSIEGKTLHLDAWSALSALSQSYALSLACRSKTLPELLGDASARYSDRWLFIESSQLFKFSEKLTLPLPQDLVESEAWDLYARRVAELGFNGVIFGVLHQSPTKEVIDNEIIVKGLETFTSYGIRVAVQPYFQSQLSPCPLKLEWKSYVESCIAQLPESIDIFWRSLWGHRNFISDSSTIDYTLTDLISAELRGLEKNLGKRRLIYYLPPSTGGQSNYHVSYLEELCLEAGSQTTVAFSFRVGEPWQDHQPLHPYWEKLRKEPYHSSTPLLSLVNIGAVAQGAGLWPNVAVDQLNSLFSRMQRSPCKGFISLAPSLPDRGTFLECSLWVAAQSAWRGIAPDLLLETWLKSYHGNSSFEEVNRVLKEVRSIILGLSQLEILPKASSGTSPEAERYRMVAEGLLGRLNALRSQLDAYELQDVNPLCLANYVCYFVRDAKRLILKFLQSQQISMANVLSGCDMPESFFTHIEGDTSRGIGSGVTVSVSRFPRRGAKGSQQEAIYLATT